MSRRPQPNDNEVTWEELEKEYTHKAELRIRGAGKDGRKEDRLRLRILTKPGRTGLVVEFNNPTIRHWLMLIASILGMLGITHYS